MGQDEAQRILVGTASWTDASLVRSGRFYPRGCSSPEARLRHYASQFALVEVDSSYYALPSVKNAAAWAQRTPEGFVMNVKAFRAFTGHQTPVEALPPDVRAAIAPLGKRQVYYRDLPEELRTRLWSEFTAGIEPLRAAGRLGAVHFQFAPWVTRSRAALDHVEHCVERLPGCLLSIEFRHASWFDGDALSATLGFLREHALVHTVVDAPQGFDNTVPAVWEVTHPELALVRLHGRNTATWNIKGATASSDRFNYDYPESELRETAGRLRQLARGVKRVHVIFNNNYEDQGQRNARTLRAMLAEA
jgi:uncharacterized protein YecE (DUF72 family)